MSNEKQPDIRENRLRELKIRKLRHQIWEHRIRILATIVGVITTLMTILGAVQFSVLP